MVGGVGDRNFAIGPHPTIPMRPGRTHARGSAPQGWRAVIPQHQFNSPPLTFPCALHAHRFVEILRVSQ